MAKIQFFLLFLIILCPILWANETAANSPTDRFEEVEGRGLVIQTTPRGARVFINGIDRGLTPITLENIQPGEYNVRLTRDGYKERSFDITLFSASRLIVSCELEEIKEAVSVSVLRDPQSPHLLPFKPEISTRALDDTFTVLSQDNTAVINLPAGNHIIRARAFGWEETSVSVFVSENTASSAQIYMKPAAFKMENISQSRRKFNPENSGNLGFTEYRFDVTAPGKGFITIFNSSGAVVYQRQLENFNTRFQQVTWNGKDLNGNKLPQGLYTVVFEAQAFEEFTSDEAKIVSIKLETEINYLLDIFYLPLDNVSAGLTFCPMPNTLAAGSYQFDAGAIFNTLVNDGLSASIGFPFKIGVRFAPAEKLELTSIININPQKDPGWSISASFKYNFLNNNSGIPLAFSAGILYSWASETGEPLLSCGQGIGLFTPVSFEFSRFLAVLCPTILWQGFESFIPELHLSAGLFYMGGWFNCGLSVRSEIDFNNITGFKFLTGAEAHFYPPVSNLVFYIQTGMWTQNTIIGVYAGFGMGLVF
ncbi:MAG: PEGA domain-containing protein [Treponema sp.]|nr:PEGA domain-containing protein [Treponema sp.]